MPGLADLDLRPVYRKGWDSIADDFYLPCMARADEYARAVGYFRSSIFILAWPSLRDFVRRGGRIQILCSQVLAKEDIAALDAGYEAREESVARSLVEEVRGMLDDDRLREPTRILAALVADGVVDVKVALLEPPGQESARAAGRRAIFHDKLGIFRDDDGSVVVFHGSMNETWNGLSPDGNLESVHVQCSWLGERDRESVALEERAFSEMWNNTFPTLDVIPFPEVARDELVQSRDPEWQETLEDILAKDEERSRSGRSPGDPSGRTLRSHQRDGLEGWEAQGRRGILAFVTGGGKTFTAITAIRQAISERHEQVVVLVPDRLLFAQWYDELKETLADLDVRILRAGAGHTGWRSSLSMWTSPGDQPRLVLATVQTAAKADFRDRLRGGDHLFLVADEVHRLGSRARRPLLDDDLFGARLGLSATPERAGDADGTAALLNFFGPVVEPRFLIADAVKPGPNGEEPVLTPYMYTPHTTVLGEDEIEEWRKLTKEISRLVARQGAGDDSPGLADAVKRLLIARARIVKQAASKVPLAVAILSTEYEPGQRWLVYCDDQSQMHAVCDGLLQAGLPAAEFFAEMPGDRDATLDWLRLSGGIVVSIKCLDEGVDIPSVSHALIIASSKNPREFIQRRGRVLRRDEGKSLAYVHDVLVLSPRYDDSGEENASDPILEGELGRAIQFAQSAFNPGAEATLHKIATESGLDWQSLVNGGVEDDDEQDEE